MAKRKPESNESLDSWGRLMAEVPEVEELLDYCRKLPAELAEEERKALVVERFHEFVVKVDQSELGDGVLTPELLATPIWDTLRELLDMLEQRLGPLTVRDGLVLLARSGGLDDIAYAWIKQTVETGRPAPYPAIAHGTALTIHLPGCALDGGPLPVVVSIVTPETKMADAVERLRDTCYDAFKDVYVPTAGTIAELARIVAYRKQGRTIGQIAWLLLGERYPEIRALPSDTARKREYPDDYKREMARLRQLFNRLPKERDINSRS